MRSAPFMIAALLSAASSAAQPPAPAPAPARPPIAAPPSLGTGTCLSDLRREAASTPATSRPRRLGELPPGDLQLTVMREVDGCHEPVIVRQGFGAIGGERR
ncbi:MAG TPA: hypothetical protein VEZ20_13120 [Allosphingosinicella sp.]|nr:hypothetical protein [Allosphingosinicella sp.]